MFTFVMTCSGYQGISIDCTKWCCLWWCRITRLFLSSAIYHYNNRENASNWWKTYGHPCRLFCLRQRWWKFLLSRHLCYGPWWCLDCNANSNCFHPMWDAYRGSHRCHQPTNPSTKHFWFWTYLATKNWILQNRIWTPNSNQSTSIKPNGKSTSNEISAQYFIIGWIRIYRWWNHPRCCYRLNLW